MPWYPSLSHDNGQRYILTIWGAKMGYKYPHICLWFMISKTSSWQSLNINIHQSQCVCVVHDDVIKWKHFPRYWPFVREIHRSPVNSPHKGQWHGALMFSLICVWINGWVNNGEAGDLRRYRTHYDVTVILQQPCHHMSRWLCVARYFHMLILMILGDILKNNRSRSKAITTDSYSTKHGVK